MGLSRLLKAQPHMLFSHHTTSACSDSRPGSVSQQTAPGCIRVIAVAEKPDSDRSLTTVWKARAPEAKPLDLEPVAFGRPWPLALGPQPLAVSPSR